MAQNTSTSAERPTGGTPELHLGVALDGAGWHPAAWREPAARPRELGSAGYWTGLATEAEAGLLDFVSIEDALRVPSHDVGRVRSRVDAHLIAALIAPATSRIGLIPTVTTTHTEPFHVSTAIATLDAPSRGRAGWQPRISPTAAEAAHFGRRTIADPTLAELAGTEPSQTLVDLFEEAADAVEVARRLWDSWEDDAEIRDVATRRFIDRDKLHRADFSGRFFSVRGPSITPRPPQGQPVVAALGHAPIPYEFAARAADLLFVTPTLADGPAPILALADAAVRRAGRDGERLRVYADLVVLLDSATESGAERLQRLDAAAGSPFTSDAAIFAGSADDLADVLLGWSDAGVDGVRLRPGALPDDLTAITRRLVPALQARGRFRTEYPDGPLRTLLGLPSTVPNRYATV